MTIQNLDGDKVAVCATAMQEAHNTEDQSGADERAKFEAWARSVADNKFPDFSREGDGYWGVRTNTAWLAWRAASTQPAPQDAPKGWREAIEKIMQSIGAGDHPDRKMASYAAEQIRPYMDALHDELELLEVATHADMPASDAAKFAVRIADFKWHICAHDEFHRSLWQLGIGAAIKCVVRLSDGTGIQYFDREPNELLNLVQTAEIFDSATPQPFPAPAVQSGDSHYSADDLANELATIRDMFPVPPKGSPLEQAWGASMGDPMEISGYVAQAIAQTAPAVAGEANLYVEVRECDSCGHIGINDSPDDKSACNTCGWTGDYQEEDHCPGCAATGTMTSACAECGEKTRLIADTELAAPSQGAKQ